MRELNANAWVEFWFIEIEESSKLNSNQCSWFFLFLFIMHIFLFRLALSNLNRKFPTSDFSFQLLNFFGDSDVGDIFMLVTS